MSCAVRRHRSGGSAKAFDMLATRLAGNLDGRVYSAWQAVPSLDPNVINEATIETYAAEWTAALDTLLSDANARLPGEAPQNQPDPFHLQRPA